MKISIQKRLFVLLAVSIIPLTLLFSILYRHFKEDYMRNVELQAFTVLKYKRANLERSLALENEKAKKFASTFRPGHSSIEDLDSRFAEYYVSVSKNGKILGHEFYGSKKSAVNLQDWRAFKDLTPVFQGKQLVLSPALDPIAGHGTIRFIFPIFAKNSATKFDSALIIALNWERFINFVNEMDFDGYEVSNEHNHLMIIREDGVAIGGVHDDRLLKENLLDINMRSAKAALSFGEGFIYEKKTEHGNPAYVAYAPIGAIPDLPPLNWGFLYLQEPQRIEAPLAKITNTVIAVWAAVIMGIVAFSYYFSKMLAAPIVGLTQHFSETKDEELKPIVLKKYPYQDEVLELYNAYNKLVTSVNAEKAEKEKSQIELLQSLKMAAIGNLSSSIVHEINNPLSIALIHLENIKEKYHHQLDNNVKKSLNIIYLSTNRIKKTVKSLLSYSRQSDALEEVDIHQIIKETTDLLGLKLKKKNITIELDLQASQRTFLVQSLEVQQMFMNLLANAHDSILDAQRDKGVITVKTRNQDNQLIIDVSDNGLGISEANKKKLFKAHFTTKMHGKGTGLGLHQIYKTIKDLNGTIDVQSVVDAGANFKITLPSPLYSSTSSGNSNGELFSLDDVSPVRSEGQAVVLIVDDEEMLAEVLKIHFEESGLAADIATNAHDGLQLMSQKKYLAVFSDINMPEMSGINFHHQLRAQGYAGEFYLMSGHTDAATEALLKNTPEITGLFDKPFQMEKINAIIERLKKSSPH